VSCRGAKRNDPAERMAMGAHALLVRPVMVVPLLVPVVPVVVTALIHHQGAGPG
jgi:hypothetical protein